MWARSSLGLMRFKAWNMNSEVMYVSFIPSPNIKPPTPLISNAPPIVVYYSILGAFTVGGGGGPNIGGED